MSKLGEELIKGLEDVLKHTKGEIELKTTVAELQEDGTVKHEELKKTKIRIDKEPDGKQELDYGKEELDKETEEKKKKKKDKDWYPVNIDEEGNARRPDAPEPGDLSKKWSKLKKALNSSEAFLDIEEGSGIADQQREELMQLEQQAVQMAEQLGIPPEEVQQMIREAAEQGMPVEQIGQMVQEALEQYAQQTEQAQAQEAPEGGEEMPEEGEITPEQLEQMLMQEGGGEEPPPEGDVAEEDMMAGEAAPEEVADQEGEMAAEQYAEENPEMAQEGVEPSAEMPEEGEMSTEEEAQMLGEMTGEDPEQIQEDMSPEEIEQQLEEALLEAGHTEAEIAYILHGHGVPMVDPVDQSKISLNDQKSQHQQASHENEIAHKQALSELEREHRRRMQDAEYHEKRTLTDQAGMQNEHKKRMLDLEYEHQKEAHKANDLDLQHKKRMLDLEYETAKKEKELELEAKRKELELKLRDKEDAATEKRRQNKEVGEVKHKQRVRDAKRDASMTSKAEREGKMQKSIEEIEDLQKAMKLWNHRLKDGILHVNHPEHGTVSIVPNKGKFDVKYNGKVLGTHDNPKAASLATVQHMRGLVTPMSSNAGGVNTVKGSEASPKVPNNPVNIVGSVNTDTGVKSGGQ